MSIYPVRIEKISYRHKGGTKDYHLTLAIAQNGHAVLIKRWGKKNASGQIKTEKYDNEYDVVEAFSAADRQRGAKGYQETDSSQLTASDLGDLKAKIGRTVWPRLDGDTMRHLDPAITGEGMRAPEVTRDEDGNWIGGDKKPDPEFLAAQKAAEEEKLRKAREREQRHYESNPLFGRFG